MKKDLERISNEELENVSGGGKCSKYSSKTYDELNLLATPPQKGTYHPLIVTLGNTCPGADPKGEDCNHCDHGTSGIPTYCWKRSKELDMY